jgi:F420-non-reducing hydrogenase iron-sulfur subunit
LRARKRIEYLRRLLEECGIGGERVGIYNMSSAMGTQFAEAAREIADKVKILGPNPMKTGHGRNRVTKLEVRGDSVTDEQILQS